MARFTLPRDLYHGKGALEALKSLKGSRAMVCVGGGSMLVDAGFGLFWQIPETFYIGLSATNIFESKGKELLESSSTSASFMGDRTFYLTAGYEYQFNNPVFVLMPSLCVMSNIAITQINAGAKLLYNNKFWFGVNYRYQESVAAMAGFKINDIQIGRAHV